MQASIFDLPINSTFGDLPIAIIEPKAEPVSQPIPQIAPRASPMFAIGAIVQNVNYFKKRTGEIIRLERFGDFDFAIVRYQWHDSSIDYPALVSCLKPIQETCLLNSSFPAEIAESPKVRQEVEQEVAEFPEVGQLRIGDQVKVLEHQFVRDLVGVIKDLSFEMATVYFGASENIWCIWTGRLQKT